MKIEVQETPAPHQVAGDVQDGVFLDGLRLTWKVGGSACLTELSIEQANQIMRHLMAAVIAAERAECAIPTPMGHA